MRSWQWLLPLLALAGCKRRPVPAPPDAGSPVEIFVLRTCDPYRRSKPQDLLRLRGTWAQIAFPKFNESPCAPDAFALRQPDDLWVSARCGPASTLSTTVLLRRGHPQTLVEVK